MQYPRIQIKHNIQIVDSEISSDSYSIRIGETDSWEGHSINVNHENLVEIRNEIDKQLAKSCQILKI